MLLDLRCMRGRARKSSDIRFVEDARALRAGDPVGGHRVDLALEPVGPALTARFSWVVAQLRQYRKDRIWEVARAY